MIGLDKFKVTKVKETDNYGEFIIGPLPKGYGYTISNSLRRLLLSSIQGFAVTGVKIDGVKHEYSTLDGVQDDILAIILRLKELSIKNYSKQKAILKLNVKGKKNQVVDIKASDFDLPSDIEIVNADLGIVTLTKDVNLNMEVIVEAGTGYSYAEESMREEIGVIPVDSLFSPVKKVEVNITRARVGQITNLDQVELKITTNGTILPSESLLKAGEIYDELANRLVDQMGGDSDVVYASEEKDAKEVIAEEKKILISELNLSTRLTNSLLNSGITNLYDLSKYSKDDVINFRGMGKKSFNELEEIISNYNISFKV